MAGVREINWFRSWPGHYTFSMLAAVLSLLIGVSAFLYEYSRVWTPMERTYLKSYVGSGIVALSPLHTREPFRVLVYEPSDRLAEQKDVDAGATLRWTTAILAEDKWNDWLKNHIYGGVPVLGLVRIPWYSVLASLILLLPLGVWRDARRARRRRDGVVLRGARLVSRQTYHLLTRKNGGVGWLTAGKSTFLERCAVKAGDEQMVRIDRSREDHHIIIMGDTGTRKSNLMLQIARQVRARNENAVIFDPEREFLAELYNPATDVVLNPFDQRCPAWNPSDEVVTEGEAAAIAKAVFPDIVKGRKEDPFFIQNGRRVFRHLLEKRPSVEQLWEWVANADTMIDKLVRGTALFTLLTPKAYPQRAGILGVLSRANEIYDPLKRVQDRPERWSAQSWVTNGQGFAFITSTPSSRDSLRPLTTLLFDVLLTKLCSCDRRGCRPVWLFLDEVASLDTIPQLPTALTMGRKAQMKIVLGLQNRAQLEMRYDLEAETIMSQPYTKIILRLSDSRSAEMASKCVGDQEAEDQRESRSRGGRHNKSSSTEIRMRPAVMPAEIENWPDGCGILKVPGLCVKLEFPYIQGKAKHPGFIPSETTKPIAGPLPHSLVTERPDWGARKLAIRQRI